MVEGLLGEGGCYERVKVEKGDMVELVVVGVMVVVLELDWLSGMVRGMGEVKGREESEEDKV